MLNPELCTYKVYNRYTCQWFGFSSKSLAISFAERCDDPVIVYEYSYEKGTYHVIGHT